MPYVIAPTAICIAGAGYSEWWLVVAFLAGMACSYLIAFFMFCLLSGAR